VHARASNARLRGNLAHRPHADPTDDRSPAAPDAVAAAHGERVVAVLREHIAASGGWIPFDEYMRFVLYAPGLGYYATGARKLGPAGDFTTAPEMTPLFAQALATQVAAVLRSGTEEVIELGAGSGALAADLLVALDAQRWLPLRYAILEVSADLRERQRVTLAERVPHLLDRVVWLDALPERITGLVVMNEVLDAIPCSLVARIDGAWYERGVCFTGERLAHVDRPLPGGPLRVLAEQRFPRKAITSARSFPRRKRSLDRSGMHSTAARCS